MAGSELGKQELRIRIFFPGSVGALPFSFFFFFFLGGKCFSVHQRRANVVVYTVYQEISAMI